MISIPDLTIDLDGGDPDALVTLEQNSGLGTIHSVSLHPSQVRLLAERMGLLAPSSSIETDRTIARLCRQMRVLYKRIDQMETMFLQVAEKGHEDVDAECAYSRASVDIAEEFIKELPLDESGALVNAAAGPAPPDLPRQSQLPLTTNPKGKPE